MSQHRKLIATQNVATDCPEDDSDYAVQTAQDRLKRKTFLRKLLICVCVFLLIIVVATGVAAGVLFGATNLILNHKKHRNTPTASPTEPPGNIVNSNVLDYIDTFYDPCENFYKYSCGSWRNSHPDAPEWGTFEDLSLDNYNKLAGYLSRYVSSHDPDSIKKAKYIYSACTDTDYIEDNYVEEAKNFMINKGGGWENGDLYPYKSWSIDSNLYEDHYLGSFAFFNFGIFPDDMNSSKPVITVI